MLAPQSVDIHSWDLSNYYFTLFHICRTIRRHFSLRQVKLCICQRKYKQKFTTQERRKEGLNDRLSERPSEWIRARSLNSYFAFCKIVVKIYNKQRKKNDYWKHFGSIPAKLDWKFLELNQPINPSINQVIINYNN